MKNTTDEAQQENSLSPDAIQKMLAAKSVDEIFQVLQEHAHFLTPHEISFIDEAKRIQAQDHYLTPAHVCELKLIISRVTGCWTPETELKVNFPNSEKRSFNLPVENPNSVYRVSAYPGKLMSKEERDAYVQKYR